MGEFPFTASLSAEAGTCVDAPGETRRIVRLAVRAVSSSSARGAISRPKWATCLLGQARQVRQRAAPAWDLPGPDGARGQSARWRARANPDALGFSATAEDRHPAGHERPERIVSVLARLAQAAVPLSRAAHQLQRVYMDSLSSTLAISGG
jgi:hypothetical protein